MPICLDTDDDGEGLAYANVRQLLIFLLFIIGLTDP